MRSRVTRIQSTTTVYKEKVAGRKSNCEGSDTSDENDRCNMVEDHREIYGTYGLE